MDQKRLLGKIHDELRCDMRKNGRDEEPSALIIDSQSGKAAPWTEGTGYDAGKKIKGVSPLFVSMGGNTNTLTCGPGNKLTGQVQLIGQSNAGDDYARNLTGFTAMLNFG